MRACDFFAVLDSVLDCQLVRLGILELYEARRQVQHVVDDNAAAVSERHADAGAVVLFALQRVCQPQLQLFSSRLCLALTLCESVFHVVLEQTALKLVEVARNSGAEVSGPVPLPTRKEVVTILRSPHKHKDSREQFELRTHKRVIDVKAPNQATVDALMAIDMPAGVEIEVKL